MKRSYFLWLPLLIFSIASCMEQVDYSAELSSDSHEEVYVLHPRDPRLITSLSKRKSRLRALEKLSAEQYSADQYIGMGYKVGDGIIGHPTNLTYPILNLEVVKQEPSLTDALRVENLGYASTSVATSIESSSAIVDEMTTKRVKAGFSLNLGLFTLGYKRSYTETFKSFQRTDQSYGYGRLDLFWYDKRVHMNNGHFALRRILLQGLRRSFVENLYYETESELLEQYGPFAVVDYYTGGRASSQYLFEIKKEAERKDWGQSIQSYIGATYSWGPNLSATDTNKVSLSIGVRSTDGKDISSEYNCSKIFRQTSIFGGDKRYAYAAPPQDAKVGLVDLGAWFQSLVDEHTHTLVDIGTSGLVTIDHMIPEENFASRVQQALRQSSLGRSTKLILPSLTFGYVDLQQLMSSLHTPKSSMRSSYERPPYSRPPTPPAPSPIVTDRAWVALLTTRHGDRVVLVDANAKNRVTHRKINTQEQDSLCIQDLERIYSPVFDCEIKVDRGLNPLTREISPGIYYIPFDFVSTSVFRYRNEQTGVCYIYDKKNKVAFSYYDDPELLELYGLNEWVEGLQERKISLGMLASYYRIIGL
ncbi:MAG: hypothetical protein HXN04_07750 [Porphyromonadaceae bacterium]|nr:hypothetical protein [Porphyromonadaceae bacterium]